MKKVAREGIAWLVWDNEKEEYSGGVYFDLLEAKTKIRDGFRIVKVKISILWQE